MDINNQWPETTVDYNGLLSRVPPGWTEVNNNLKGVFFLSHISTGTSTPLWLFLPFYLSSIVLYLSLTLAV